MNQTTTSTPTPTKRIEYIDALRGFTIILVVFHHILSSSFSLNPDTSLINGIIVSFFMPLFFFISGFIGYKTGMVWNGRTWWTMIKDKMLHLLPPALILGLIYTYVYSNVDFSVFLMNGMKLGYWFTIVLFEMFFIFYSVNLFLCSSNLKTFKRRQLKSLLLVSILFCGAKFVLERTPALASLGNFFCLSCLFKYFPYFVFGLVCSMNKEQFNKILENGWFSFWAIIMFCIGFYLNQFYLVSPMKVQCGMMFTVFYYAIGYLIGFLGLLIVYNTFRVYQSSFTVDKKIGRILQYIGKRTLDIYLLHYFFLPKIPQFSDVLSIEKNVALLLVIGGGLSLVIVGLCLIVSNILRTSPVLAKFLFGVKK